MIMIFYIPQIMEGSLHEMIVDFRSFKDFGIEVTDIIKRLMDYGFRPNSFLSVTGP